MITILPDFPHFPWYVRLVFNGKGTWKPHHTRFHPLYMIDPSYVLISLIPQRLCRMCGVDTRDWNRPIPKDAHNNASLFHSILGYQLLNIRVWFDIYFLIKHVGNGLHDKSTERRSMCLFVWGFSSHSRIFHSYEDVTIASEGLQILTYAPHSWPLSSEESLVCHNFCDTGLSFIMVISEDLWPSLLLPSV